MFPTPLPNVAPSKETIQSASNLSGLNQRDFAKLIKNAVFKMTNHWKSGIGELRKAPGSDLEYEVTTGTDAGDALTFLKPWFPGYQVFAYGTVLKVRDTIAGTTIDVKDDFTADVTDGRKYSSYFYVADGNDGDNIGYLKATLAYDTQTANYTVGKILTGATSAARAVIIADADGGTTGTLTLRILSGSFSDGEVIADNNSTPGSAKANGTLAVSWTEIADAPACEILTIIGGNRLGTGNTDTDVSEVHISRVDQLSGVPFALTADWTVATDPDSPFKQTFPDGGEVQAFGELGSQTAVLLDDGKFGFRITQVDVSGTGLVLDTPIDFQNIDFGASSQATSTSQGVIYVNESGVWIMASGGLTKTPYSAVDDRISRPLGREFTKDYTFVGARIVKDDDNELLLIACRDNSSTNNKVLVYHLVKELRGWAVWTKNISCWLKDGKDIYFGSASDTSVSKFDYDLGADNDLEIYTELVLEWNSPSESLVSPKMVSMAGRLGSETQFDFSIDVFDKEWSFSSRIALNGNADTEYSWTTSGVGARLPAVGSGAIGAAAVGGRGVGDGSSLIPSRGQRRLGMSEYLRVRGRLTSFDKSQSVINLFTIFFETAGQAEASNLT